MDNGVRKNTWVCVACGETLGNVIAGELHLAQAVQCRTSGPNLVVVCPECSATKIWYTSDAVVRAVYQLIDALSSVAAKSMVAQIGDHVQHNR